MELNANSLILFCLFFFFFFFSNLGINRTALREIKLLQELSHPNIIGVSKMNATSRISLQILLIQVQTEILNYLGHGDAAYFYLSCFLQPQMVSPKWSVKQLLQQNTYFGNKVKVVSFDILLLFSPGLCGY